MANGLLDAERQYLSRLFLLRLTNENYELANVACARNKKAEMNSARKNNAAK